MPKKWEQVQLRKYYQNTKSRLARERKRAVWLTESLKGQVRKLRKRRPACMHSSLKCPWLPRNHQGCQVRVRTLSRGR